MTDILRPILLLLIFFNLVAMLSANLLECRIISSVCQDDLSCFEQMQVRFPYCFTGQVKRSWDSGFGTDKRALKLMNIIMKVDRIPVG